MEFDEHAGLDTSQIDDQRGRRSVPGGLATLGGGGLGIVGLVVVVLLNLLGGGSGTSTPLSDALGDQGTATPSQLATSCQTGADANAKEECRIVGVVNSVQSYWTTYFQAHGTRYVPAQTRFFSGQINTGCGTASAEVGPFYCPADKFVYIDLSFYDELQSKFGAKGGPFAQAYVIAHEYGHHIQDLTGYADKVGSDREGPTSGSVRLELQADCLAGLWAHYATTTPGADGRPLIVSLTDADIADGLDAAAAVGDDRIQQAARGRVSPESFTHGTSEQRQRWFRTGYESGSFEKCDTFAASNL